MRAALKVLIAPDKFKGTLSAQAAASAMARGWSQVRPDDSLLLLPMSDGGEGFGEVMGRLLGAEAQAVQTMDAAHRPVSVEWWREQGTATAIIESAAATGLSLLPPGKFHPFELDTFGLAAVLRAAACAGAKRCLVGIGGSATNDGGFGVACGLGWHFFDEMEKEIERWTDLQTLTRVQAPNSARLFEELTVAVDVQNPLLGPSGCTRVFGPQKGLRQSEFEFPERCLAQLAAVTRDQIGSDFAAEPGSGAAGGLGFGLRAFAGAKLKSGFELFSHYADLVAQVKGAQVVLTGEGRVDEQTFMGKGVGKLGEMCRDASVPCIAIAGEISIETPPRQRFHRTYALAPELTSGEKALVEPDVWLTKAAAHAAREVSG